MLQNSNQGGRNSSDFTDYQQLFFQYESTREAQETFFLVPSVYKTPFQTSREDSLRSVTLRVKDGSWWNRFPSFSFLTAALWSVCAELPKLFGYLIHFLGSSRKHWAFQPICNPSWLLKQTVKYLTHSFLVPFFCDYVTNSWLGYAVRKDLLMN